MVAVAPDWAKEISKLWEPPPRISGSDWAVRFRVLGEDENADRPGPFVPEPWQRLILDALADPAVDWVAVLKAVQMGVSEVIRCAVGYWAMCAPGNVLWVMATEAKARTAMEKLQWMFKNSPALQGLVVADEPVSRSRVFRQKKSTLCEMILTNGMRIVIGWAGSPASLSSDQFRYVVLDETGKYPKNLGKKGQSPVKMGEGRIKTFGRQGKVVLLSSPDHEEDLICTEHAKVRLKKRFAVPCPDCGHAQPLGWSAARWPGGGSDDAPRSMDDRGALADRVEAEQSAWYACSRPQCEGEIRSVTNAMADERSSWIRADLDGATTETVTDEVVSTRRVAFHISEIYHWKTSPSDLVAKFLRCPVHELQDFWNDSLGLPLVDVSKAITAEMLRRRSIHQPRLVPEWATTVLATADTQIDHFWYVVRAWGTNDRSRILDFGKVATEAELDAATIDARFAVEGVTGTVGPSLLLIDSGGGMDSPDGSRTHLVYKFCEQRPRARPYKGDGTKQAVDGKPVWESKVSYTPKGWSDQYDVVLVMANANLWQDKWAALVRVDGPPTWELTTDCIEKPYTQHMTGKVRVTETTAKGISKTFWKAKSKHARYDLQACEYMQLPAASIAKVSLRTRTISSRLAAEAENTRRYPPKKKEAGNGWQIGR